MIVVVGEAAVHFLLREMAFESNRWSWTFPAIAKESRLDG